VNPLLPPPRLDADAIVRGSKSSFLPAFHLLRPERRRDLVTFYAFCKTVDDIADAGKHASGQRYESLEAWRSGFRDPQLRGLPADLAELIRRRGMPCGLFLELLDGTATDLTENVRMATRADLDLYCHRVAGTVGQLCLPIFGADAERCADYAETLGRALQYTNILRDTAADARRGRIYFPLDELAAAGIDEKEFPAGSGAYLARFADQTELVFASAEAKLPIRDRTALKPARIMASIYRRLLRKMRNDGLRVTDKPYRLSLAEKIWTITRALATSGRRAPSQAARSPSAAGDDRPPQKTQ
jgi:phytoene synthase